MSPDRPHAGQLETRSEPLAVDGQRIRGRIPYGTESRDMGGWTEIIEPGALQSTRLDDLVATVDHAGVPIGRYPGTLELEDRADGLHWAVDPPQSRQDVREAVERGDLRAGSWRMRVGRDEWRGDVRHVHEIAELRDVAVVTTPAYEGAAVELRNHNPAEPEEGDMPEKNTPAVEPENTTTETTEERAAPAGSLHVEDRAATTEKPRLGLADEFRSRGFPGEIASVPYDEFRTVTPPTINTINAPRVEGVPYGADERYAYTSFPQVAVGADTTAVQVMRQSARSLATAANVVRTLAAVTAKPETSSTLEVITVDMKQVATIQTAVPNVLLEQPTFNTVIENDLRLAISSGLDKLLLDGIATAGFQAPGTDSLLVSIRKCITTITAAGYNPNLVVLTPANAQALDTLMATGVTGEMFFVFQPAQVAPRNLYGLPVAVSKTAAAPFVVDTTVFGKLYASPVTLARFEADGGTTNTSNVRMELSAAFGVERAAAAVRIAAS